MHLMLPYFVHRHKKRTTTSKIQIWFDFMITENQANKLKNTHRELDFEYFEIKPNFDCNYTFPIDSTPNGIPFSATI